MSLGNKREFEPGREFETFSESYGITLVIISAVAFQLCLFLVKKCGLPSTVPQNQCWKWTNLFVSFIHAMIVAVWSIMCLCLYPEFAYNQFRYQNFWMYTMAAFSTGYFVYEFIDISRTGNVSSYWEVTLHHIAVIFGFSYHLMNNQGVGYTIMSLMAEVNSVFLHSRKLLQMMKVSFEHWFYRLIVILNLATFVIFRFIPMYFIVDDLFRSKHLFSTLYYWTIMPAAIVLAPINFILFWRLAKNDLLRSERVKKMP